MIYSNLNNEDHLKYRFHFNGSRLGGYSFKYFDLPEVRELLHVDQNANPEYDFVNFDVTYSYRPQLEGTAFIYDIMLGKYSQYKVLHIHANTDGLLSTPGVWDLIKKRSYLKP